MFPWGNSHDAGSVARELVPAEPAPTPEPAGYAVGDTVYSDACRGTVVSVDAAEATMGIVWSDGDGGAITYPIDATYLRKAMPWE